MKLPVLSMTDRHMTFTSMSAIVDIDRQEKSKKCKVIITLCCLQSIKTYQTTFFVLSVAEVGYSDVPNKSHWPNKSPWRKNIKNQ